MRILFFGSSITQGFWDSEGGWVARIRKQYDTRQIADMTRNEPIIFNLGVSGDSSAGLLKRIEAEITARMWPGQELVLVIAIGVNDACIDADKRRATVEEYGQNITKIIKIVQKFSPKILFVGLTPCDQDKTTPVAWGDYTFRNQDLKQLDDTLRELCSQGGLLYVPVFEAFVGKEKQLLIDGLHPNNQGHELIANLVRPELEKLIKA